MPGSYRNDRFIRSGQKPRRLGRCNELRGRWRGRAKPSAERDGDSFMRNVWIDFPEDYLQTASNGNHYIVYHVYNTYPDDARRPVYRGFVFDNNHSQLVRLVMSLADAIGDDDSVSETLVNSSVSADDLFDYVVNYIDAAIRDACLPVTADVFVREPDDSGYRRVFLCAPSSQRDTIGAIIDRISGSQNQRSSDGGDEPAAVTKALRVTNKSLLARRQPREQKNDIIKSAGDDAQDGTEA